MNVSDGIAERIRVLRKSNGLSQSEFAEKLGVTLGVIYNMEKDRITQWDTKMPLLNLMCEKYGCRKEWLLGGDGTMMQDLSREQEVVRAVSEMFTGNDDFKQDIISMMVKLPDEHWELLKEMAQRLLSEQSRRKEAE